MEINGIMNIKPVDGLKRTELWLSVYNYVNSYYGYGIFIGVDR